MYARSGSTFTHSTYTTVATTETVLRISGARTVIAGERTNLMCNGPRAVYWYRWNKTTREYNLVSPNSMLTLNATVEDSGEYMCCDEPRKTSYSVSIQLTVVEKLSALQVVAMPAHPIVTESQGVALHCSASTLPSLVVWSWHRLGKDGNWQEVDTSQDLTLNMAEQSGQYRCQAESKEHGLLQMKESPTYTVHIIAVPATVGEKLGIAAFSFSLLALIILSLILVWLVRQRANDTAALQALSAAPTSAKGLAGPGKAPKGAVPQSEGDRDVYMNYSTNQAYTDLEPAYMTGDDVYSSLS